MCWLQQLVSIRHRASFKISIHRARQNPRVELSSLSVDVLGAKPRLMELVYHIERKD